MTLILADSRPVRFFSFFILYLAQGFPFGMVNTAIPGFLAERGESPAAIGAFIGIASLPWSFKLLAAPLMDRFTYLAMGRRRPWVIVAQAGMLLAGAAFMFFPDGLDNLAVLTVLCFMLNCFSATQDVAVDGMAIDVLPPSEHGRANSFMAMGQVLGISGSGVLSAFILQSYGLPGIAAMLFAAFGLILFWSVAVRERSGEKLLPWTKGEPHARSLELQAGGWAEIGTNLMKVLFLPASLLLAAASFLFLFAHSLWLALATIVVVQDLGHANTAYNSYVALTGPIAAVLGLLLGHYIDSRGIKQFYIGTLLCYGLLAAVVGFTQTLWSSSVFLMSVGLLQACIYQGTFISFIAIHMRISWVKVAVTQFSLYMAWVNLARSLGPGSIGLLEPWLERNEMYFVIALCFLVAIGLVMNVKLWVHEQKLEALNLKKR
ncbi:MAG TPA: MFS transporter [Pseudomonadales bacterium]